MNFGLNDDFNAIVVDNLLNREIIRQFRFLRLLTPQNAPELPVESFPRLFLVFSISGRNPNNHPIRVIVLSVVDGIHLICSNLNQLQSRIGNRSPQYQIEIKQLFTNWFHDGFLEVVLTTTRVQSCYGLQF